MQNYDFQMINQYQKFYFWRYSMLQKNGLYRLETDIWH